MQQGDGRRWGRGLRGEHRQGGLWPGVLESGEGEICRESQWGESQWGERWGASGAKPVELADAPICGRDLVENFLLNIS